MKKKQHESEFDVLLQFVYFKFIILKIRFFFWLFFAKNENVIC